jgi:hypothetical protein
MAEEGGDDDMVCYFYSVQRINDYTFNSKVLDDVRPELHSPLPQGGDMDSLRDTPPEYSPLQRDDIFSQRESSRASSPTKRLNPENIRLLREEDFEDGSQYSLYKKSFQVIRESFVNQGTNKRCFEASVFTEFEIMKVDVDGDTLLVFGMANYVEHILGEHLDVREWAISLGLGNKQKTKYEKFSESLYAYHEAHKDAESTEGDEGCEGLPKV